MFKKMLVLEFVLFVYMLNNISTGFLISIEIDNQLNENDDIQNASGVDDLVVHNLIGHGSSNVLETLYASSSIGKKSHRFYYTLGERQNGMQVQSNMNFLFPINMFCLLIFSQ